MITIEEFFNLPTPEVMQIVSREKCPLTGIFLSDGNRRLVTVLTGKTSGIHGEAFYRVYLETVTSYFMKNLEVFFDHGLKTLVMPLLGPALLEREEKYRTVVLPGLVNILFKSDTWKQFYKNRRIRVKSYGNLKILEREFPGMNLVEDIGELETLTASNREHTLYFGFFSTPWLPMDLMRKISGLTESGGREPEHRELVQLYYGEYIPTADFFINSIRIGGLGALPPLITGKNTGIYTMVAPGIFALNRETYRTILYDILFYRKFCRKFYKKKNDAVDLIGDTRENKSYENTSLKEYYLQHRNTVLGAGKRIGRHWVMETNLNRD
jgi:hypothetical protein